MKRRKRQVGNVHPIYIRITIDGIREEWSTTRKCDISDWDKKGRVKGTKEEARSINAWLETLNARAYNVRQELYAAGKPFTPTHIRKLMQGEILEPPKMLSDAWNYHTNQIAGLIGKDYTMGTLQKYKTVFKVLKRYILLKKQVEDLPLNELDYKFVRDFDHYLKTDYGVKINTAVQMVKKLRTIIKIAYEIGWISRDPFIAYRARHEEVHREYLNSFELHELATKRLKRKRLIMVRDLFLFSCYTGLSYADTVKLKRSDILKGEDGGLWIQTYRMKNNNRVRIPLLSPALRLIEHYKDYPRVLDENFILPKVSNQKANAYLKDITAMLGWTKRLTFHCARHTFATTVTLTNGVPIETVGQMLGHKSIGTTQLYARITDTKVSRDMKPLKKKYKGQELFLSAEN
ncbi:site-specific integrase [Mucilaginibacter gynuensis]|uniref:Site-specific integrase n=1 Tax=Mucilaginibacter gynuensis TaxID=1302236 RepID=A0ABP8HDH5_9SPHI